MPEASGRKGLPSRSAWRLIGCALAPAPAAPPPPTRRRRRAAPPKAPGLLPAGPAACWVELISGEEAPQEGGEGVRTAEPACEDSRYLHAGVRAGSMVQVIRSDGRRRVGPLARQMVSLRQQCNNAYDKPCCANAGSLTRLSSLLLVSL